MGATTTQLLSSGEFSKLRYDSIPVKSVSSNASFHTNNSKMPNFELWHSCRKWAICFRIFWAFFKQGIITDTLCKNFRSTVYIDALNLYLRVWEFKSPLRLNVPQEAGSGRPLCTRHKIQDTSYVLSDYQIAKPPPPPLPRNQQVLWLSSDALLHQNRHTKQYSL